MAKNAPVKVVVASGYPKACLIPKEQKKMREEISKEIDVLPREEGAPRFDDIVFRSGAIVVKAAEVS